MSDDTNTMKQTVDTITLHSSVYYYRTHPENLKLLVDTFLGDRTTGTFTIAVGNAKPSELEFDKEDSEYFSKKRIAKWIEDRWSFGEDLGDTAQVLLEFEQYLNECEAERQRV